MRAFVSRGAGAVVLALLLGACASAPERPAMQVTVSPVALTTAPGGVEVAVSGGRPTSELEGASISDDDFKAAVEASLVAARAFERVAAGASARYALNASIVRLTRPLFGGTFTVEFEVAWTLTDRSRDLVLMRKGIATSGTATMSEAFAGAARLRLALEAASRANIQALLRELAAVKY